MTKKYDIIYSIGRDCACAMYMKKTNLRLTSGPFDWLTNAGFEQRFHLMMNDFDGFLDKDLLQPMEKPAAFPADKNNNYYKNTKTDLYFWHDFPADEDFDKAYVSVKNKYDRRIERFYKNIRQKNKVLLIWFSQAHNTPDEIVSRLCNDFCKKMNKEIDFLIIEHTDGLSSPVFRQLQKNISRCNCHARKTDDKGVPTTLGQEELLLPVFRQYKIKSASMLKIKTALIKISTRFICLFIPVKKWRKKIRDFAKNN